MAKATLPTNYQDDVLKSTMGGKRRYTFTDNSDGTKSLEDVTQYDKVGSNFGAADMNKTNAAVNAAADASKIIDNLSTIASTTQAGYMAGALAVKELNQNLQELKEGLMKIATKTVTVTTGNSGNTYQNEIDLNDMGLDVSKIVACYFEPSNAQLRLGSTAGGICTIAKDYNTATGKLLLSIGTTQHCLAMTWTGTVIAITA